MKFVFLPQTRKGRWSVLLFAAFIALMIVGGLISSGMENTIEYPNPLNSPLLGTVIYLMFSTAIIASVMGLMAVRKDRERSLLVFLSIPLGMLYLLAIVTFLIANLMKSLG